MLSKDVMTTPVISVLPETTVHEIAKLLLKHGISAVPVLDPDGKLLGVVSEGDLLRRTETGTERRASWWLDLIGNTDKVHDYIVSHGTRAEDVMTREIVSVDETATLAAVATLLEKHRIKRVPVLREGKVIGIVSRANLLQGLAAQPPARPATLDDAALRTRVLEEVERAGVNTIYLNVVVYDHKVQLWGSVNTPEQRVAARIAAEAIAGADAVESNLSLLSPMMQAYMGGL